MPPIAFLPFREHGSRRLHSLAHALELLVKFAYRLLYLLLGLHDTFQPFSQPLVTLSCRLLLAGIRSAGFLQEAVSIQQLLQ
ncbi:hypothetical protein RP080_004413 [Escherichia coli]|nr:hypothetical protein [Escherichia coli]ELH2226683.1 hypothetical protein [Escherichia coli]ELH2274674.1 hypothetical protein [Escherichia coli]ELH2339198.1 hypothetical protein [Escherichia coli]